MESKIFLENVVYTKGELFSRLKRNKSNPSLYAAKWYKPTPAGPELFTLPEYDSRRGYGTIQLLPNKVTCDIWVNEYFEIESVLLKSFWGKDSNAIPIEQWLEDIEKELRKLKEMNHEQYALSQKSTELFFQIVKMEEKLGNFPDGC